MKVYTYSEARQRFASVLDAAQRDGAVRIRRRDGRTFVLQPEASTRSPLDVEGRRPRYLHRRHRLAHPGEPLPLRLTAPLFPGHAHSHRIPRGAARVPQPRKREGATWAGSTARSQ